MTEEIAWFHGGRYAVEAAICLIANYWNMKRC